MFHPATSLRVVAYAGRAALGQIGRLRIWLPLLLLAFTQSVVLHLLSNALDSRMISVSLPLVRWVGGEPATHYPSFFYYLPAIYSRVDYAVSVLVGSLAIATATLLFAGAYRPSPGDSPWRRVMRRLPALVVVSAALVVAALLVFKLLNPLSDMAAASRSSMIRWGVRGLEIALLGLVYSLLAYSTAWIVLRGMGVLGALKNSVALTFSLFLPTFLIMGIPLVLLFPVRYLAGRVDLFVEKFRPESLVWVLQTNILLDLVLTFVVVGSITRLFLSRTDETS